MNTGTVLIDITDQKAFGFLHEMEALQWIKIIESSGTCKPKLSEKYRGALSKEQGESLREHIHQMRSEWDSI
ncbi:MAG: hypothetical protein LBR67_00990 [Dysgonamonadaceae bacterium]|jgi:hypothetical protein|nr:hypothetical protein [Dysgonamonadaceae bacterium]